MTIKTSDFRGLSLDELYGILRLRAEVFVVGQNCPYQDLDDLDKDAYQVWAEENGEVIGCRISSEQFFEVGIPHYEMIRPSEID